VVPGRRRAHVDVLREDGSNRRIDVSPHAGEGSCSRIDRRAVTRVVIWAGVHCVGETALTLTVAFLIVPSMFGLNQICGIIREIIR